MFNENVVKKFKFFGRVLMLIASGYLLFPIQALPLPTGADVVAGQSQIETSGNQMTITQTTDKAIINWQGYSIDINEIVKYIQPSANSISLNRVVGIDPSIILGQLIANGRVWIVNPNGIFFGKDAVINVGGIIASTLNIKDSDFLSGKYEFTQIPNSALSSIINKGKIIVNDNGYAILVAPLVSNEGLIVANLGKVIIAGSENFVVNFDGNNLINFTISKTTQTPGTVLIPTSQITNIIREVVNTPQIIEAGSIIEENGNTYLVGASGTVINSGTISASSGKVDINSTNATVLTKTTVIDVSGTGTNSGGEIKVLSSGNTAFARNAQLLAKGGEVSGDGGFIEISAGKNLYLGGSFNVLAVNGENGSVLIDPVVLTIKDGTGSSGFDGDIGYFEDQNEVYESELESWVGNITLQAEKLIIMEDLTDDVLFLQTGPGQTFKMEVLNGSIEFQDINDSIITQGGNIQISSYGYDSDYGGHLTLGSLYTNGGDIILQALGSDDANITAENISTSSTTGDSGNVSILGQVANILEIYTSSSSGNAGDIDILLTGTGNSFIGNNGVLAYSTFAGGNAGDVTITATYNNIEIGPINTTPGTGGTAGNVQISATDIYLWQVATGGGSITLISNTGDVGLYGANINTSGGILQITGADTITQLTGTTINTGSGNITFTAENNITIDNIITTGEALISSNFGSILEDGDLDADITANKVTLTAGTDISIGTASSDIIANATGNITIYNVGVGATAVLNSTGTGDIAFTQKISGNIDITASTNDGDIFITNEGPGNILANNVIAGNNGMIYITAGNGDVYVDYVETGGTVGIISAGAVEEEMSDVGEDIVANGLIIDSGSGVGVLDIIEIDANILAVVDTSNSGVYLTDTAGGLTIGTIDIYSGITTSNGEVNISASSPLIIDAPISAGDANITLTASNSDGYIEVNSSITNTGAFDITLIANGVNVDNQSIIMSSTGSISAGQDAILTASSSDSGDIIVSSIIAGRNITITADNTGATPLGSILDDGDEATVLQAGATGTVTLTADVDIGANTGPGTIPTGYLDIDIINSPLFSITTNSGDAYLRFIGGSLNSSDFTGLSVAGSEIGIGVDGNDLTFDDGTFTGLSQNLTFIADNIYLSNGATGASIDTTGDVWLKAVDGVIVDTADALGVSDIVADNLFMEAVDGIEGDGAGGWWYIETSVNSLLAAVTDISATGNIAIDNYTDITINALTNDGSGYIDVYAVGSMTVDGNVTTSGGDIYLYADNGLTINADITSNNGYIYLESDFDWNGIGAFVQNTGSTIDAGTNVVDIYLSEASTLNDVRGGGVYIYFDGDASVVDNGTTSIIATDLVIDGGWNNLLSGGINLYTQVSNLQIGEFATSSGDINIENTGGLTLTDINSWGYSINNPGGKVTISTTSPLTVNGAVYADGDITLIAGGAGDDDLIVLADVQSASGDVILKANKDILINNGTISAGGGYVTLTADINTNNTGMIDQAGGFIGSGTEALVATAAEGIYLGSDTTSMMSIASINASTTIGDILIFNDGSLNVHGIINNSDGDVIIKALSYGFGGNPSITLTTGALVSSNGGVIFIGAEGDIIQQSGSTISSNGGMIGIEADLDVDNDRVGSIVQNGSATITSGGGDIWVFIDSPPSTGQDILITSIDAGTGNLVVATSGGAIIDNDTTDDNDITGNSLFMAATEGIGSTNAIETTVSYLDILNYTGDVNIANTGDLILADNLIINDGLSVSVNGGDVNISTSSTITITDPIETTGGDLTLTATTGIYQNSYINTESSGFGAGDYVAVAGNGVYTMASGTYIKTADIGGDGNISITADGDITITDINAGAGTVSLTSNSASILDDEDDSTYITAGELNLTAALNIGATDSQSGIRPGFIDIDPTNLGSNTITLTGDAGSNIYLNFLGDFESAYIVYPNGVYPNNSTSSISSLTIGSSGDITINSDIFNVDDAGNPTGIYYDLYLLATNNLILSNDIVTNEDILQLATGGSLTLTMANITFNNPDGTLILWADFDNDGTGALSGGSSGSPITLSNVSNLVLIAAEGIDIYTVADSINIAAYNSTSGEINIDNVGDITVFDGSGYVGVPGIDVNGINNLAGGDVNITAHSDVNINAPINTGGGDLTITATGSITHTVLGDITTSGGTYTGNFDSDSDGSGAYTMADDGTDASVIDVGVGDVYLVGGMLGSGGEGITLSQIVADTAVSSVYLLTSTGSISETDDETGGYDITANQLVMAAADGISIDNLRVSLLTAENSTSGDIVLTNTAPVAELTITTSPIPFLTGVQNNGGSVYIVENSPIIVNSPVFATGDITLVANDSAGVDNGSITNNATITSSGGSIYLYAGTDVNIGANIQATGIITILADDSTVANNNSTGTGSVVNAVGTLIAPYIILSGVDIGTSATPISTDAGVLEAYAGSGDTTGGVYIAELNQINLAGVSTYDGDININADGTIDVSGSVYVGNGNTIYLTATGAIVQSSGVVGDDSSTGNNTTLILQAANGINLNASDVTYIQATNTTSGNIEITNTGTSSGIYTYGSGVVNNASGGDIKIISANPVTIEEPVTASGGNIEITSVNDFQIKNVISTTGSGTITLTATGANGYIRLYNGVINGSVQSVNGKITLDADQYITMDSDTSITSTNGDIELSAGGNIAVSTITTSGDVVLTSGGAIIDNNGATNNITADILTINAVSGIDLDTNINTLTASVSGAGNIIIDEVSGIALTNVTTANGNIIITAGGNIDVNNVNTDGDITLTANGAGSDITVNGNLTATDDIILTAQNIISGSGLVSGDLLEATAPNGISLITNINTLTATTTNTNINITEENGLTLNDVNAVSGDITLTLLAGTLTSNTGTKITGDELVVNGADAININTNVNTLTASTNNADITITEDNGLALNLVDAGLGDVYIEVALGAITDNNGPNLNIIGTDLILSAETGIGSGDAIETKVTNLTARVTSTTATGNIEIENTGDLTLGNLAGWGEAVRNFGSGDIIITVNSNLTIDASISSAGGDITLTANTGAIIQNPAGDITTGGGNFRATAAGPYVMADGAVVNSGVGIIDIDAGGDITIGQLITSSTVYLNSGDVIIDGGDTGGEDIQASAVEFIAANGIGTVTNPIDTSVGNMAAITTNGQIYINETNNLTITTVGVTDGVSVTNGGPIWLNTNGGALTLLNANQDIVSNGGPIMIFAGAVTQNNGADIISSGGNIDMTVVSLTQNPDSKIDAGTGNVTITATGNILLDEINGYTVSITTGGSIEEQTIDTEIDITGTNLILSAATGIGSNTILETEVSNLNAYNSTSGNINIDNAGDLTIDNFAGITPIKRPPYHGFDFARWGVYNNNGSVFIDVDGSINIPGTNGHGVYATGDITLIASVDINAGASGNDIAAAWSWGGNITLDANGDIYLGQNGATDVIAWDEINLYAEGSIRVYNSTWIISEGEDVTIQGDEGVDIIGKISADRGSVYIEGDYIKITLSEIISEDGTYLWETNEVNIQDSIVNAYNGEIVIEADNSVNIITSELYAGKYIKIYGWDGDVTINSSEITADNNYLDIYAEENVTITDTSTYSFGNTTIGARTGDVIIDPSLIVSDAIVVISAGNNITILDSEVIAGNSAYLTAGNDIQIGYVEAENLVDMEAGGSIYDNNQGDMNIVATDLIMLAGGGIGSYNGQIDPIETRVSNLQAGAEAGDIYIENTGDINLEDITSLGFAVAADGDVNIKTTEDMIISGLVQATGSVYLYALGGSIFDNLDNDATTPYDIIAGKTSGLYAGDGTIGIETGTNWFDPLEVNITGDLYVYASDMYNLVSVAIDGIVTPKDMLSVRTDWGIPPGLILFNGRVNGGGESEIWFRATGNAIHYIGIEPYIYETLMLYIIDPSYFELAPSYWDLKQFKKAIESMALK